VRAAAPAAAGAPAGVESAAHEVAAIAADAAAATEEARRLAPPVVDAIIDAGFARHFVPARWGGNAGTFRAAAHAASIVAEGHMSAGWCASLYASHARLAVHLPLEGQADIWADGPDVKIAMSVLPAGRVRRVAGGWLLNGGWAFTSGVDHASWALLVAPVTGGDDRFFAVPRRDFCIRDTWYNVGLRGTGSNTVVVDGVFVPGHRSFPREIIVAGQMVGSTARCHEVPFKLVNGLPLIAPALGAVRASLGAWTGWIAGNREPGQRPRRSATVCEALARASAAADCAQFLTDRMADTADHGRIDDSVVARSCRDSSIAAGLLTSAADLLFRAGGAHGQIQGSPVERVWRDVNAAAGHAALRFEANAAVYADHVLGSRG
jgi:two-component flavin-dependent monooxygenase